jgi:hydroxyacylglutathione hydrolase
MPLQITALPAFADNYIWAINDGQEAWVVDPGDAGVVEQWLETNQLRLRGILVTHHHPDHTGGIARLTSLYPVRVLGPRAEQIAGVLEPVQDGDVVSLDPWTWNFTVLAVPGHTLGHIAYFAADLDGLGAPVLFCGDTLFAAGCGRLFEGTPDQMWVSLSKLAALPGLTRVYCTHEYTVSNLKFAHVAEPENAMISARLLECQALRSRGMPTLPSSLAVELLTNPFVRAGSASEFARLRRWKDEFRSN